MIVMRTVESRFISRLNNLSEAEAKMYARECLMEVLNVSFAQLLARSPLSLSAEQWSALDGMIVRLSQNEPLQYVLGHTPFHGLDFKVSPDVLIPRPETSELVDWVISCSSAFPELHILDAATGSGCIAVSLANALPKAHVSALDVSDAALRVARSNASACGVVVDFFKFDLLAGMTLPARYDVVVSNPPYVCDSEKAAMEANVLDYEPHLALFVSDSDPLIFYRRLAKLAFDALNDGGMLFLEINERFGAQTCSLISDSGFSQVTLKKDFFGKDRMIMAVK